MSTTSSPKASRDDRAVQSEKPTTPAAPAGNIDEIRMERGRLIATLFYLHARPIMLALSVVALALLLAGIFIDLRWAIVFLMVLFIVAPMAMSFLYFYHGLKPATAANVVPHFIKFTPEGISLDIIEPEADSKWDSDNEITLPEAEDSESIQIKYSLFYPYHSIKRCRSGRDGFIVTFTDSSAGFIWIPYSRLTRQADKEDIIGSLQKAY